MAETDTMTTQETAAALEGLSAEDRAAYVDYLLHLGDAGLILGHRLGEWCGHGPILEEDIALTNIALDLIGQARMLLTHAGRIEGAGRDEDVLAYRRDVTHFRNPLICETPNGDFAMTIARQFLVSAWGYELFSALQHSTDPVLAGAAAKSLKEVSYHRRHTGEWLIRLGDGTAESKRRAQDALDDLWLFTDELFEPAATDRPLIDAGLIVDVATLRDAWDAMVDRVLGEATLTRPETDFPRSGGRTGAHSEDLGFILAEMQFLQRAYPDAQW